MAVQRLFIPGPLPDLNEILDARMRVGKPGKGGKRWNAYSDMKRSWGQRIALYARQAGFRKIATPSVFVYEVLVPDRRRDPSNLVAGAVKLVEDALQDADLLKNDNWEMVRGISASWRVEKLAPGVNLTVLEA